MNQCILNRFEVLIKPPIEASAEMLNGLSKELGEHFAHLARAEGEAVRYLKDGDSYVVVGTDPNKFLDIVSLASRHGFLATAQRIQRSQPERVELRSIFQLAAQM